jgi:autotransporter-associated beta strand protein
MKAAATILLLGAMAGSHAQIVLRHEFAPNAAIRDHGVGVASAQTLALPFGNFAAIANLKVQIDVNGRSAPGFAGDLFATLSHRDTNDALAGAAILLNRPGVDGNSAFGSPADGFHGAFDALPGFAGASPNGRWQLYVEDRSPGGLHTLAGWALEMTLDLPANQALTLQNSSLKSAQPGQVLNNAIQIDGPITVDTDDSLSLSGALSGAGSLAKKGGGALTLAQANSFEGGTLLQKGSLALAHNSALGLGALAVTNGKITSSGAGRVIANSLLAASGVIFDGDPITWNGAVSLADTQSWTVENITTIAGVVSGEASARLTKKGAGKLIFTAPNTFAGGITHEAGVLALGHDHAPGSGSLILQAGVSLEAANGVRIFTNSVEIDGDCSLTGTNAMRFNGPLILSGHRALTVDNTNTIAGVISQTGGPRSLVKQGAGLLILSGANTFSGGLLIAAGNLKVSNTTGSATGSGAVTLASGARLSGSGRISGALQINGTYAPGDSPGTLRTGSQSWNAGAAFEWEINDATGAPGANPGWDFASIDGGLQINATAADPFTIKILSLTPANTPGPVQNFDPKKFARWKIAAATFGVSGLEPGNLRLDASGFQGAEGTFAVALENSGRELWLNYSPPLQLAIQRSNGALRLIGQGAPSQAYALEIASTLNPPDWTPFATITASETGEYIFDQPFSHLAEAQFFRIVLP